MTMPMFLHEIVVLVLESRERFYATVYLKLGTEQLAQGGLTSATHEGNSPKNLFLSQKVARTNRSGRPSSSKQNHDISMKTSARLLL